MPWRHLIGKNSVEKLYQVNEGKSKCKKKIWKKCSEKCNDISRWCTKWNPIRLVIIREIKKKSIHRQTGVQLDNRASMAIFPKRRERNNVVHGQANIAGAAGRACLRSREDLGRVGERVWEGLSIKGTLSNEDWNSDGDRRLSGKIQILSVPDLLPTFRRLALLKTSGEESLMPKL